MANNKRKNIILNSNAVIIGIILCIGLIILATHADRVDKAVLLEDKNPGYWDYSSPAHINKITGNATSNKLIINQKDEIISGVRFTVNKDSSITVKGSNLDNNDIWFEYASGLLIPDGVYYFQTMNYTAKGVSCYIVQRRYEGHEVFDSSWFSGSPFEINHLKYNQVVFGINVASGSHNIDEIFYPMLTTDQESTYSPARQISKDAKIGYIVLERDQFDSLSSNDYRLLNNYFYNSSGIKEIKVLVRNNTSNSFEQKELNK